MEITIQQKGDQLSRRNFKLKNGSYENSAYNDVYPTHYLIVARFNDKFHLGSDATSYRDKFYPNGQHFIVLGEINDEEFYFESEEEPENFYHCLQELAIELAEEIGLIPDYTILDVFENRYNATLYGDKS